MEPKPTFTKLDQTLEGTPIVVGRYRVQPIARLVGGQMVGGKMVDGKIVDGKGHFASAFGQLSPHAIQVQEGEQTYTIPVTDPLREIMRGMVMAGLAVSAFCLLIMAVAGRVTKRQRSAL